MWEYSGMYTVYKVINKVNEKYYIGVHKTNDPYDSYMGSGVAIRNAIKKYGKENFHKEVLFITEDKDEAYSLERSLTSDYHTSNTYNMKLGGVGGWALEASLKGSKMATFEHRSFGGKKSYEMQCGIHAQTSEEKKNAGKLGGLANRGKAKSAEHKAKIAAAIKKKRSKHCDPASEGAVLIRQ
jgi:hypothetical protein